MVKTLGFIDWSSSAALYAGDGWWLTLLFPMDYRCQFYSYYATVVQCSEASNCGL